MKPKIALGIFASPDADSQYFQPDFGVSESERVINITE